MMMETDQRGRETDPPDLPDRRLPDPRVAVTVVFVGLPDPRAPGDTVALSPETTIQLELESWGALACTRGKEVTERD